jgi:hypothetical protein
MCSVPIFLGKKEKYKIRKISMKIPAILFIFSPLLTAQQFTSRPSGREVLTIPDGFSYHGLRRHRKPLMIDSPVVTVTSGSATVSVEDGVADALAGGSSTYLFEIESGDATPFLPNEPRTIPLFTAFPPKANS